MPRTPLTIDDLDAVLEDDRHLGFGYGERDYLSAARRADLDREVVKVANEIGIDREDLFRWANSKNGRWLCDDASSPRAHLATLVPKYLSADVLAELRREEGLS